MDISFTEQKTESLSLRPEIIRAVTEMGFNFLTPVQAEAIPHMLNGSDVIGQAQTGTGKTAAFGLPILNNTDPENDACQALILCPTRELAMQVAGEIRNYAKYLHGIKTLAVYGGQDITKQIQGLKGTQIVVGTPGRVMDHIRRHTLKLSDVHTVILDEADEMLDMGFREDMEVILGSIECEHQTAMFSATMPDEIREMTSKFLHDPIEVQVTKEELTIPNIDQFYYSVKREYKVQALVRLITYYNYKKCMIFCNKKSTVDSLVSELQKEGCMAEALHGDLTQFLRDAAMERFRANDSCVLVATDIAARGIDVGNVEAVFNFDIPQEAEYYVHRIGRTGRAGKEGVSHTLVGSREFHKIRFIESICHSEMTERTVPTPEEIQNSRMLQALEQALSLVIKGNVSDYISSIHSFCNDNAITPEELAAGFLALKIGTKAEELDIDLPSKKEKRTRAAREKREYTKKKAEGKSSKWGNFDLIEKDSGYDKAFPTKSDRYDKPFLNKSDRYDKPFLNKSDRYDKPFPDKSDRKENKLRSKKVLEQAIMDVKKHRKPFGDNQEFSERKNKKNSSSSSTETGKFFRDKSEKPAGHNRKRDAGMTGKSSHAHTVKDVNLKGNPVDKKNRKGSYRNKH